MRRNTQFACLLAGALAALAPFGASAQMPPDIAAKIKEIGRVVDPPKTAPIYAPLHEKEPYAGVKVTREQKYGPDARNALDVFTPENATGPLPVYIFVHGGGFVAGNKRGPNNSPFYDNFMLWAAKNGMVGVNMTYRLAPANPWPAAPQDIAAAVKWVRANIASHGGDPERIFLAGSSAGGAIVGGYIADPRLWPNPNNIGVKGVLLLAGIYDFTSFPMGKGDQAYVGTDPTKYDERSPLKGIVNSRVPLLVAYAELDPPGQVKQGEILYANLCNKNRCPKKVFLPNHSHMSTVYAVNTDDKQLTDAMLEFIKGVK
ncbi:MAG TPA: alpha/beta hydrolase [Xanthobacteraceae bacterium]|jgi:triacylglycerol lipase